MQNTKNRAAEKGGKQMPEKTKIQKALDVITSAGGKLISVFSGILAAFLIIYSGYLLYDSIYVQRMASSNASDLMQYRLDMELIDDGEIPLSALAKENNDYRAWISLYDTPIDYPVMQGENDLYYASHDIHKKNSLTGAIYLSHSNSPDFSDSYNLIYGHHMDSSNMFGPLDEYMKPSYLEAHKEGILVSNTAVYDLTVFATVETNAYETKFYTVGNQMETVLGMLAGGGTDTTKILYFNPEEAAGAQKIVALSTCESVATNGRLVVFAVMKDRGLPVPEPEDEPEEAAEADPGDTPTEIIETNPDDTPEETNEGTLEDDNKTIVTPAGSGDNGPDGGNPASPSGSNVNGSQEATGSGVSAGTPETASGTEEGGSGGVRITMDGDAAEEIQELEDIEEGQTPLAQFLNRFHPSGGSFGTKAWALVNLICLIITIYLFLPLLHLKEKYARKKLMKRINEIEALPDEEEDKPYEKENKPYEEEDEPYFEVKRFVRRFRTGMVLEAVVSIIALIAFILTEDMRLPMTLIDKWTPLMLILLAVCWIIDVRLARYREKEKEK